MSAHESAPETNLENSFPSSGDVDNDVEKLPSALHEEVSFSPVEKELLDAIAAKEAPALNVGRGVYSNRDLDMSKLGLIGFDMDYTLAIYNKKPMEKLQYDLTVERLVGAGYPEEIRQLEYDPDFVVRGLIVDKRNGWLIKADSHGQIVKGFHGRKPVKTEKLDAAYRTDRFRLASESFASVDTLFAYPEMCLYANLVSFFAQREHKGLSIAPLNLPKNHQTPCFTQMDTWKLYDDVRKGIDDIHRDGSLKSIIMENIAEYIVYDPDLPITLHKLRSAGKRLFLLTNSYWTYTDVVMSYLLDGRLNEYASWRAYFEVVITGGRKPGFFADREPFLELDTTSDEPNVIGEYHEKTFDRSKVYQGGNMLEFEEMVGFNGEEILYVGDHIFGDILRSQKDSKWRTCLVVEELEVEISCFMESTGDFQALMAIDERRHSIDNAIARQRMLLAHLEHAAGIVSELNLEEEKRAELVSSAKVCRREIDHAKRVLKRLDSEAMVLTCRLDDVYNPHWGRLLKERNELTRFGAQVVQYACTYTSRVSNFIQYSPMHYFRAPREMMSHDYVLLDLPSVRGNMTSS
ncbi:MAG: HAD-IG family 5'-nucleotidase [Deltaproteobacteria bacterium]|nr:HAD-IG family 5'-nucleotidase [Deltaproteobacteria bacterium]